MAGLLTGIADLANVGVNIWNAHQQAKANDQNIALQREVNEQNLAYARESRDLQFEREDNAVRRRVADLEDAGLNKALASGGAAAGSAPSYQAQAAHVSAPQMAALNVENLMNGMRLSQSMLDMQYTQQKMREDSESHIADLAMKQAETANVNARTASETFRHDSDKAYMNRLKEEALASSAANRRSIELQNAYMLEHGTKMPTTNQDYGFTVGKNGVRVGNAVPPAAKTFVERLFRSFAGGENFDTKNYEPYRKSGKFR